MYINFWYPAGLSADLTDTPRKVRMLGLDFVLFRDSGGKAHCLSNTCVHRGGSLSAGVIRDDCIQCPYHGWRFDGQGRCQRIPSLGPDGKFPARTKIDAYPVEERYGLVFAFLGDLPEDQRPPIMALDEFGQEGWRPTWLNYQIDFNYERSVENGLDPAHNEFVYPTHGFSGQDEEYKVNDLRLQHDEWGFGFFSTFKSPEAKDPAMRAMKEASDSREAGSGHVGPNHLWTHINFAPGKAMHQYMFEAPIDESHVNIFLVNLRSTMLEAEFDDKIDERNRAIVEQDLRILDELHPVLTPPSNTKEVLVPADKVIGLYREKLDQWTQRGWRIDSAEVERSRHRVAYTIPSPTRREHKNWVLDTAPLIKATSASARLAAGKS